MEISREQVSVPSIPGFLTEAEFARQFAISTRTAGAGEIQATDLRLARSENGFAMPLWTSPHGSRSAVRVTAESEAAEESARGKR